MEFLKGLVVFFLTRMMHGLVIEFVQKTSVASTKTHCLIQVIQKMARTHARTHAHTHTHIQDPKTQLCPPLGF